MKAGLATLFLSAVYCVVSASGQHNPLNADLDLYKISWKGPLPKTNDINLNDENVINISTKYKEQYTCIVPNHNQINFDTSAKNSSSAEGKLKSPVKYLEPLMLSNFCSYKFELYWIYELCHGKYLRQYHEESTKSKITQEFYLGKMNPSEIPQQEEEHEKNVAEIGRTGQARPTILVNGVYKPYVMFNMTGGTRCDLTKKNRVSRIIYVCNEEPSLELYSIKEISTCEYEAIVLSPSLCHHKDFKSDTSTQHEIKCYSVGNSPRRPKKAEDYDTDQSEDNNSSSSSSTSKAGTNKRGIAYFQGRTLIIDADFLLN